jgi:hypothetical protein
MTAGPLTTALISPADFQSAQTRVETQSTAPDQAAKLYFLSAFAIGQAIQINNGYLHPAAIAWLAMTLVLLIAALRSQGRLLPRLAKLPATWIVTLVLAIQWTELVAWGVTAVPGPLFIATMVVAAIGAAILIRSIRLAPLGLAILVAGHFMACYSAIASQPIPRADVWHFQQTGTTALLRGENPYGNLYRNVYEPDTSFYGPEVCVNGWLTCGCPYPPLSLIATLPGRMLGDIRWSHVVCLELAAILLALAAPRPFGFWAAAMLTLMPRSLLVIKVGWTEPLVILLLIATLYCAIRSPRWLWLAIGLLLASKQYTVLMIPLIVTHLMRPAGWRHAMRPLVASATVALVVTLPMALWDWHAFASSVVLMQFRQPFRIDALSFTAMLAQMTGMRIGVGLAFIAAGAATIWAMRRVPRTPAGFAASTALIFALFFAFNKQAFCNYYFVVFAACCCAAALASAPLQTPTSEQE